MKPQARLLSSIVSALLAPALHAGTTTATFSFQQGDLRKDGNLHGAGASYSGVLDGHIVDANTTTALTTGTTATIGNQFQTGSPNGRNFVGLYSYDLTELDTFIAANTSPSSTVTVTSVSFKLVASGTTVGGSNGTINLFRTDPFTSGATWPTTNGTNAWSSPYQNLASPNDTVAFGYTGGGSALTSNLGGTSPSTGSKTAGSAVEWTSSANFVAALNHALAQPDNKLHLMAARGLGNADGRVPVHTSSASGVDTRPELVVTLAISSLSDWTGAVSTSWATAGNWTSAPGTGDNVRFNSSSTANLATVLNQDFSLNGIALIDPSGPVSIGGASTLTLGTGGLDLTAATQDLTITAPLVLGDAQTWNVAGGRTLNVGGAVSGSGALTLFGAGKVSLGASNILPNGAGAGNLTVSGTLDLNGTPQSVNGLNGTGIVDNTAAGSCVLTVGNNDASGTFSGTIQDTGGALGMIKTGSGSLSLTGANTFSGGFTNNGTGQVFPQNSSALGTGPVVMNASTLYATTGSYTLANALTLNGANLRQGGANNRLLSWTGPLSVTADSAIQSDGGTAGITITGDVTLSSGATLTSTAGGTAHTISGAIGGTGSLTLNTGSLILGGTGSYSGTTLINSGTLRLDANGTIPSASNLTINGAGNFNVRNTVAWIYNGTITGDGTGQINLNSGTNATLAGDISGVVNVNANTTGTNATISGDISGATNVTVQSGGGTLTLSGSNTYTGTTNVLGGTLVVAADDRLPDATVVTIGNGTLDLPPAVNDTVGKLVVTHAASTINLGLNATVAFADSGDQEANWTGTLNITGNFVSGQSLRFGNGTTALTDVQLGKITAAGFTGFDLNESGFLTAIVVSSPYDTWKAQITNGLDERGEDADGDGFTNLEEFLFGTSPIASNGSLASTEKSGPNLIIRWNERIGGATYTLLQSATLGNDWVPSGAVPANDGSPVGDYQPRMAAVAIGAGELFFRVQGSEN